MTWQELRSPQLCVDARVASRGYTCGVFKDLRPTTLSMSVLVVVEMFNALNALSENRSLLMHPPWQNSWLLAAIGITMLLHTAILYGP
jgi:P-type Ca2+ transporter type 2A